MIISKKWLGQYMDLSDVTIEEMAERITDAGLEVEGVSHMSCGNHLVIGKVLSCEDHPDSDHLHVCQVDLGEKVEQIVCGAPNVATGKKVIVARVGAKLPGGEIKEGVIRGVQSNGMLCSLLELGVDAHILSEDSKNGIELLDEDAPVGNEDPLGYLGLDDAILDVGLTPNRNDCMSAWSMALETGAILHKDVTLPYKEGSSNIGTATQLKVSSETEKCPLFLGKIINELTIKPSPKWMKELLLASGIKSINNVVDISNIVMLETGQPLHFYDVKAIPAKEITVKDHQAGPYTALDGVEYELTDDDIVITTEGNPIGIAGIMGGDDSKIEETTTGIIIEAASFNHVSIRNSSRRLNLNTDASVRFQKGIEPMAPFKAMDRAVQLLIEYADAKGIEETAQYGTNNYTPVEFNVNLTKINKLLGTDFSEEEVLQVLNELHFEPTKINEDIHLVIPSYRTDISMEADIAEEVIRILGYDRLPSTLPYMPATLGALDKRQRMRRRLRDILSNIGYNEAVTYSLVSKKHIDGAIMPCSQNIVELASSMSEDRRYVRNSMLPSLLGSIAYNQARNQRDVALFELSNVYGKKYVEERIAIAASGSLQKNRWQKFSVDVDFYTMKGLAESMLEALGFNGNRISVRENKLDIKHFHPYRSAELYLGKELLGVFGEIHPAMAKEYGIEDTYGMELNLEVLLKNKASKVKFVEVSKYPAVSRDLALVVKEDIKVADIVNSIRKNGKLGKENIIQNVEVFDVYTGEHVEEGYKSIALSIVFQSNEKTLKDKEINEIFDNILETLKKDVDAELRA